MSQRWLTTREAAEFLGVHPNTIRNWADGGKLHARRTTGNQRRFDPDELAKHVLAEGGRRGLAAPPARSLIHREHYLTVLAESASVASSKGAFGGVGRELARVSGEALGATTVDVFLFHGESDELELAAEWQREVVHPDEWVIGERFPVSDFSDWAAIREGSDGVVVDMQDPGMREAERESYAYWEEASAMCVPLRYEGRLIGLMDFTSRDQGRVFDSDDLVFARVVASHVATALVNARLIEAERARAAQMEALLAIAAAVNSTVGLPQSLHIICRETAIALAADVASLYTFDDRSDEMVRVARWERGRAPRAAARIGARFPSDRLPSWRQALTAGRPVVADPLARPEPGEVTGASDQAVVSWITVPLYQDGALRGLADVYSRDPEHVFSEEDVLFAGAVAHQVEIALRGSELVERSRERSERLEEVLEATRQMNTLLDPSEVISEIVIGFGRSLGVGEASMYSLSDDRSELIVKRSFFVNERRVDEAFLGEHLRLSDYPTLQRTVREARPLIVNRLLGDTLTPKELAILARFGTRSWLGVPMLDGDEVVGVLEACEAGRERWFSSDDVRTAEIFAVQGVIAMNRARAYRRERERANELSLLLTATNAMAGTLELEAAMFNVCQAVYEALDYLYVTIYNWDEQREELVAVAYYGDPEEMMDPEFVGQVFTPESDPTMVRVARDREPFATATVRNERLRPDEQRAMIDWGTGSWLYVPMVYQDSAVGVLEVDFREEGHEFGEREIALTQAIANQAAVVLVNAQLYERQRSQTADLARTAETRETLVRFGAGLRARETAHGVAEEVAAALCDLKAFDAGLVLLRDGRSGDYEVTETVGWAERHRGVGLAAGAVATAAKGRRAALRALLAELDDGASRAGTGGRQLQKAARRAMLQPVLDQQGESVGLVVVTRSEAASARAVSRAEAASLVSLMCDQVGIAIRAAHRLVELQQDRDQAWALSEVTKAVGSTLDVAEVLRQAVRGMHRVSEFRRVLVWFLAHEGNVAEVAFIEGPEAMVGPAVEVDYDPGNPVWQAMDGARTVVVDDTTRTVPVTGMRDAGSLIALPLLAEGRVVGAIVVGAEQAGRFDDSTRVFLEQLVAPIGAAVQNARLYERIRTLHLSNLQALSTALNVKDDYMLNHAPRVAAYTSLLCAKLGYAPEAIEQIEKAAFLHDIGRIGVPDSVLQKPGKLSDPDWVLVRAHAAASADIIKPIFSEDLHQAVRYHHERWDGGGYPEGRRARELPRLARILAITDAYDAMTTNRVYTKALPYIEALAELRSNAGRQFDPELVPRFLEVLDDLDGLRRAAQEAAFAAAEIIDWEAHATLRSAGGAGREHYPRIEEALRRACESHPLVTRMFTAVPSERGHVVAVGWADSEELLPHTGEEVQLPETVLESLAGATPSGNTVHFDTFGCWTSGFVPVFEESGRLRVLVEADVAVPTGIRGGTMRTDVGETLDSILRQAAERMTSIEMAANTDGLTGLYNHRYFQERLEQELARARSHEEQLGLLFCDLDHFKAYNDAAGHQAGDEALRRLADVFHEELRRVDVAARYGGEEFAVILPDTSRGGATEVAERVRHAVESGADGSGERRLTVSIGAAVYPADAATAAELIDHADWAMYRAKRKGRNRVEVFGVEDEE